jgi:hypothetical protein
MKRWLPALALLALVVAGCSAAPPSAAQQYSTAADKSNAATSALQPEWDAAAATKDATKLASVLLRQADIERAFATEVAKVNGTSDQMAAINDLVKAESDLEVVYRAAAAETNWDAMVTRLATAIALSGRQTAAANLVRIKLGLPPPPQTSAAPTAS